MENKRTDELRLAPSREVAREAVKILLEKKALDVKMFDVEGKTAVTDYYVNATGRSATQVLALSDYVDELLSEKGRAPQRIEGRSGGAWILVDFGDVIVNVFDRASREFYNLDRHLPEGSEVDISDLAHEIDKKFEVKNTED